MFCCKLICRRYQKKKTGNLLRLLQGRSASFITQIQSEVPSFLSPRCLQRIKVFDCWLQKFKMAFLALEKICKETKHLLIPMTGDICVTSTCWGAQHGGPVLLHCPHALPYLQQHEDCWEARQERDELRITGNGHQIPGGVGFLVIFCWYFSRFCRLLGAIPRPDFQISGLDRVVRAVRAVSPVPVGWPKMWVLAHIAPGTQPMLPRQFGHSRSRSRPERITWKAWDEMLMGCRCQVV